MINALQLVSLTDFIVSALCLFLAGNLFGHVKSHTSRYSMLSYFILCSGLATFMAGIDHGFFEPIQQRYVSRLLTYLFIAAGTFFLFRYIAISFFTGTIRRVLIILASIQLLVFVVASFYSDSFFLAVGNYSPILIFFLIMNLIHIKRNKGEKDFVIFSFIITIASVIQVFEIGLSKSINGDTLYHIIIFIGYFFLYSGAKKVLYSQKENPHIKHVN